MLQTLIFIPIETASGIPIFGFGILLALWAIGSITLLAWLIRTQGFNADTRAYLPVLAVLGLVIYFLPRVVGEEQGLPIRGYGVMLLLAVSAGVGLFIRRAWRRGYDPELMLSLAFWCFVSGIVGARLFYVVEYWDRQFAKPTFIETAKAVLNFSQGGLVVFGSFIGAAIAALIFVRRHRLPALEIGDLIAPCLAIGLAIGRIGCFFNGCCFGGYCEYPWSVQFPWGSPPHLRQVEQGDVALHGIGFEGRPQDQPVVSTVEPGSPAALAGLNPGDRIEAALIAPPGGEVVRYRTPTIDTVQNALLDARQDGTTVTLIRARTGSSADETLPASFTVAKPLPKSRPIHPTQLYSSIDALLLLLVLLAWEPFQRRTGELLALVLSLHSLSRFLLEQIRIDEAGIFGTPFSISQLISIAAFAGALILWAYILRQPTSRLAPAAS